MSLCLPRRMVSLSPPKYRLLKNTMRYKHRRCIFMSSGEKGIYKETATGVSTREQTRIPLAGNTEKINCLKKNRKICVEDMQQRRGLQVHLYRKSCTWPMNGTKNLGGKSTSGIPERALTEFLLPKSGHDLRGCSRACI